MNEHISEDVWTDEVCQAWLDDAEQRTEAMMLADAVAYINSGMPPAVFTYLEGQAESRAARVEEVLKANGGTMFVLDVMTTE